MQSKSVEMAYAFSEKSGELLGNIVAKIVNVGAEYANITYNCLKIGYESFQKTAQPNIEEAFQKFTESEEEDEEIGTI